MAVKIFFCYAHEDEALLNKLKTHLRPLQRQGLIDVWYDRDIRAGTDWEQQIKAQLNTAQIILLLVSPDFMDSDYCYGIEMKRALARHERGEARVIPVILRHVYWQGVLGKLQALPEDGKPIMDSGWPNQDEVFFNVAESIRNIVEGLTIKAVSNAPSEEPLQDAPIHFKNMPINLLDSLSRKRLCPACIEEFYPGDCRILSERTREELKPAPRGWFEKHYARLYPEPLFHPKYFNKSPRRECPNCGFLLPSNFEKVEKNLNIVIVGDVGVGKTHYLAVLINELKRLHNVFYIVGQDDTESRY